MLFDLYKIHFVAVQQFAKFQRYEALCILLGKIELHTLLTSAMNYLLKTKQPYIFTLSPIILALNMFHSGVVVAVEENLDVIEVHGQQLNKTEHLGSLDALLKEQGVDFSAAGGMSSLPILYGMMGDRVKVLIDGADITAACANHMNPPFSYISANQVHAMNPCI